MDRIAIKLNEKLIEAKFERVTEMNYPRREEILATSAEEIEIIRRYIKVHPLSSDREIATVVGCEPKLVHSIRQAMKSLGQILKQYKVSVGKEYDI